MYNRRSVQYNGQVGDVPTDKGATVDLVGINHTWLDYVPFYGFFKKTPTAVQIARHRQQRALRNLGDAQLSVVEAEAEVEKQQKIIDHLIGAAEQQIDDLIDKAILETRAS